MSFDTESVGLKLAFVYLEGRINIINWKLQEKKKKKADALGSYLYRTASKYNGLNLERYFSITEI